MSSMQAAILRRDWPATAEALRVTYTPGVLDAVTDSSGRNLAGHVLFYLTRALDHARATHGRDRATDELADQLFAREVMYLARRGRQARATVAMIGQCWYNLVHERGERWRAAGAAHQREQAQRFPRQCNTPDTVGAVLAGIGGLRETR